MANFFEKHPKRKMYQNLCIIAIILVFVAIMSSYTLSWFMDESTTSNGEPNITQIGELDMDVITNFKFTNLVLAPDTIYTTDQSDADIATYIKTSALHNIDGAYVRIKFETQRRKVGEIDYVDNLDLFNLYFDGNLTTSTNYNDSNTPNHWFYNATDNFYYYLGGVYGQNIMFNAGYKTTNRMVNDVASADVKIDFTIDCIQRQYGASSAIWTTAPQVFVDMVAVESNVTHVTMSTLVNVGNVATRYPIEYGTTVSQFLTSSGLSSTINDSNSCGWYADAKCTIPLDDDDIITSTTKFYTKMATTDKLKITTNSSGKKTVTAISKSSIIGEIVIPNDVEVIADKAFCDATQMTSIVIPESVKTIGSIALLNTKITSLHIPKSVTSIDSYMGSPGSLLSITVDAENPKYTDGGGYNCIISKTSTTMIYGCKNTIIPTDSNVVTAIGYGSFRNNGKIDKLHIPANIVSIGEGFLIGSTTTLITVDSGNTVFEEIDGCLVNVSTKTLIYAPKTSGIPNTNKVEYLVTASLYGATSIHVTQYIKSFAPQSVQASYYCTTLTCSSDNPYYYAVDNCLIEKSTNRLVKCINNSKIPEGVVSIGDHCFFVDKYAQPIVIPSTCTLIETKAFDTYDTTKLVVYIPSTCTTINATAFQETRAEIYTDVASASAHPSGWNVDMEGNNCNLTWHYGTSLQEFKNITGYTD